MKKLLATAAVAILCVAAPTSANEERDWRENECRFQGLTEERWSQREVVATIECAVARWPVPRGADGAVRTAACESGLRADALSPSGRYAGLFQHIRSAFPARSRHWNPGGWDKPLGSNPFNARANAVTSVRMAHAVGWGAWPHCGYV